MNPILISASIVGGIIIVLVAKFHFAKQEQQEPPSYENTFFTSIDDYDRISEQKVKLKVRKEDANDIQNVDSKYNKGTYRDKKGRYKSID